MSKLPDFEGSAIFAKVLQMQSFAQAAAELQLSQLVMPEQITKSPAQE
jgi:DNA-binding transcriptional LysR family regulator